MRILLLKVTHLPFVALIWCYEELRPLLSRKDFSSAARMSPIAGRPFSASQIDIGRDRTDRVPTPRAALIPADLLATPSKVDPPSQAVVSTADIHADLLSLVQRLSTQVDALTSMVAGQQKD